MCSLKKIFFLDSHKLPQFVVIQLYKVYVDTWLSLAYMYKYIYYHIILKFMFWGHRNKAQNVPCDHHVMCYWNYNMSLCQQ